MVFLPQSLRYAKKIILGISNICLWLFFFACLDFEQKSLFMDGHQLTALQNPFKIKKAQKNVIRIFLRLFLFTADKGDYQKLDPGVKGLGKK